MAGFNRRDWKFIGLGLFLTFVYFNFLLEPLSKIFVGDWSRFLIFYLFVYLIVFFIVRGFHQTMGSLRIALSLFLIGIVMDIWFPPYAVTSAGNCIVGPILGNGVSDYVFCSLGRGMGLLGGWLFNFVYVFMPFLIFILARWLGARKEDLL